MLVEHEGFENGVRLLLVQIVACHFKQAVVFGKARVDGVQAARAHGGQIVGLGAGIVGYRVIGRCGQGLCRGGGVLDVVAAVAQALGDVEQQNLHQLGDAFGRFVIAPHQHLARAHRALCGFLAG